MTEQPNKPEMTDEELENLAESVPTPSEYPEGQAEELEDSAEERGDPNAADAAAVELLEVTEEAEDSTTVQAFDSVVTSIQEGIESVGGVSEKSMDQVQGEHVEHANTTVILGREYPFPLYTAVFLVLGVLTVIEVVLAELISGDIKIPFLLGIAIAKAALVVIYYMHLNKDSRIFAITLAVPLGIALLATMYLLAVPPTGY